MSVRRCILSWVFSVLACLSLSSLVAAQSRPGEHIAVLIGNAVAPMLDRYVHRPVAVEAGHDRT